MSQFFSYTILNIGLELSYSILLFCQDKDNDSDASDEEQEGENNNEELTMSLFALRNLLMGYSLLLVSLEKVTKDV